VFEHTDGEFLRLLGEDAGLRRPRGIALMRPRSVLVADGFKNRIVVLSLDDDGSMISSFGMGRLSTPESVAFDPITNRIFVSEWFRDAHVSAFDASNFGFLCTFGTGQLYGPRQLVVDDIGQIAVADYYNKRICIFAVDFSLVRSLPCSSWPYGVALDSNGDLFVTF